MNQPTFQDIPGIPSPSKKDHTPYIELVSTASDWIKNHKSADPRISDPVADFIIYISFLKSETGWWTSAFADSQRKASHFYRDSNTFWRAIAIGVSSPEVERLCLLLLPSLDREKYFHQTRAAPAPQKITPEANPASRSEIQETPEEIKPGLHLVKKPFSLAIATKLCKDWKSDSRWEKLFPCSRELFYRLIFRTYRKDTIRKIKRAISKGETYFPWSCTGLNSLEKQLTYHPKSSCRMKYYERQQIGRGLRQLWDLGFVHRIFRGYEEQGAGKYHVFLNPKMSARFNKSSIDVKRGSTRGKRLSRMS